MSQDKEWNFFISHANEDKDVVARPLAIFLQALGFKVWYDEFSLKMGDSLNQSINNGLRSSTFGLVILSPSFFQKEWTKKELNGLIALETAVGEQKILPIWHNLTKSEIIQYSLVLADIKAVASSVGIEEIIREILRATEKRLNFPEHLPIPAYDVIFPDDVVRYFSLIPDFKDRVLSEDELGQIYEYLTFYGINTRGKLHKFVKSEKLISRLRQLYREELLRPEDTPLKPIDVAVSGGFLFSQHLTDSSIAEVRKSLRYTEEYKQQHPQAKIPPTITAPRISTGKELVAVLSEALSFTFNHDDPENETAADILYNFGRDLEDYILISETASAHNVLSFKKHIQDLQELGFNVYAVVTNGTYKTQHTTVNNWKNAYIIVSKRDENSLIILPSL